MHPRQDVTHHPLVPIMLRAGAAVWTQHARSVNNDLALVHEQAILDVAAGIAFLREQGFDSIVVLGHSGGGTLYAFYLEQAGLPPAERIQATPAGRPTRLAEAELPAADGAVFLAPHPGQGIVLLGCIDPSVADEADPMSVDPRARPVRPGERLRRSPRKLVLQRGVPRTIPGGPARAGSTNRRRRPCARDPGCRGPDAVQGQR